MVSLMASLMMDVSKYRGSLGLSLDGPDLLFNNRSGVHRQEHRRVVKMPCRQEFSPGIEYLIRQIEILQTEVYDLKKDILGKDVEIHIGPSSSAIEESELRLLEIERKRAGLKL